MSKVDEWIVLLVTMVQFITLEGIRGNWSSGHCHVLNFGKLVTSFRVGSYIGSIIGIFKELYLRMALLMQILPPFEMFTRDLYSNGNKLEAFPTTGGLCGRTRQEITQSWYVLLGDFMNVMHDLVFPGEESLAEARDQALRLILRLQLWCSDLDSSYAARQAREQILIFGQESILKVHVTSMIIRVQARLQGPEELHFDAYQKQFEEIMALASTIIPSQCGRRDTVWSHGSALASVYFVALKCRDPWLRRKAVDWLASWDPWQGTWHCHTLSYMAARRIVELEEGDGLVNSAADVSESARIKATTLRIDQSTRRGFLLYETWAADGELQQREESFQC